nr:FKBP-type peptidyl-prolyl cis-trans isomerase N-terminal domain-containing protein [Desulfobacula toluolica]
MGGDFRRQGFEIDPKIFADSFAEAFNGKESQMPVGEMQHTMQNFQRAMEDKKQAEQMESGKKILKQERNFLNKIVIKRG